MSIKQHDGFTLLELMMVIAIISLLASIAVPAYQTYSNRSKFTEIVTAVSPYKAAVNLCIANTNSIATCTAGNEGIPADINTPSGYLDSLSVKNGVITAEATADLDSATYILTPSPSGSTVEWNVSGTCQTLTYCK